MNKKLFRTPDLSAPRYRPKVFSLLNSQTVDEFRNKYARHSDIEDETFKAIIRLFNETLWKEVIDNRDGVELPDSLGYLFIGTCPAPKSRTNVDYAASKEHGVLVRIKNWETDNRLGKIMYSNYHTKYQFANRELWGFTAVRQFKRAVAASYPDNWMRYVVLGDTLRVNDLFKKYTKEEYKKKITQISLKDYNEFELE